MASDHIGLIVGASTGTIYAIINPDKEEELDNPRWLLIQVGSAEEQPPMPVTEPDDVPQLVPVEREPVMMTRMPRAAYMSCTSHAQVQAFATMTFRASRKVA